MVAIVSSAQARPSAPVHRGGDVRELGKSIEQIHPGAVPERLAAALPVRGERLAQRAPTISRERAARRDAADHRAPRAAQRPHRSVPRRSGAHDASCTSIPFASTTSPTACTSSTPATSRSSAAVSSRSRACRSSSVLELVEPLVPRDNTSNLRGLAPHYLLTAEVLDGLGVADGTGPHGFTLERPDGQRGRRRAHAAMPAPRYTSAFAGSAARPLPVDPARRRRGPSISPAARRALWARTLARGRAVYVGYNSVARPTPASCARSSGSCGAEGRRRVIVDVRLNGGGDNTTYGSLTTLFGSPAVNKRGRLYLLIGRATFSAAGELRRRDRPGDAGRSSSASRPAAGSRRTATRSPSCSRRRLDRSHRRPVPRAQEEPQRPPARRRAGRARRPHLGAVLRRARSGARARAAGL